MKSRFFALAAIAVLLMNMLGATTAEAKTPNRLIGLLPASDGIAVFDSKRFLNEGLPRVLSANQPLLAEITAKIDEMQSRTGIDPRKFEHIAVGVNFKQVSPTEMDYDTVALMSGDMNFGAIIAAAKLVSKGAYRTEMVGNKSVFIFTAAEAIKQHTVKTSNSKIARMVDRAFGSFSKEIALASIDRNTLAIGSVHRVRETLEKKSSVSREVLSLLPQKENAVMTFATRAPAGIERILPMDNDELAANLKSVQFLSGSMDVAAAGATVQMLARTKTAQDAIQLKDTIDVLQTFGKIVLGGSKRADQRVYARMIDSAKFETRGNDLTLDLLVPQSDIDILIAGVR